MRQNEESFTLKEIFKIDNHSFGIQWADGVVKHYSLKKLQEACPCAGCENLRKKEFDFPKNSKNESIKKDPFATEITNVGRYALKIQFSTGCSKGIFTFAQLRGEF